MSPFEQLLTLPGILRSLLALWVFFSLGYVGYHEWHKAVDARVARGQTEGRAAAIDELHKLAENCNAFDVVDASKKSVKLIDVACLQKKKQVTAAAAPQRPTTLVRDPAAAAAQPAPGAR